MYKSVQSTYWRKIKDACPFNLIYAVHGMEENKKRPVCGLGIGKTNSWVTLISEEISCHKCLEIIGRRANPKTKYKTKLFRLPPEIKRDYGWIERTSFSQEIEMMDALSDEFGRLEAMNILEKLNS